jgi:hypothetical protein
LYEPFFIQQDGANHKENRVCRDTRLKHVYIQVRRKLDQIMLSASMYMATLHAGLLCNYVTFDHSISTTRASEGKGACSV